MKGQDARPWSIPRFLVRTVASGHALIHDGRAFVNRALTIDDLSDAGGLTAILTATTTWNPGSVGADQWVDTTITVTGVEAVDTILCDHSAITGSATTGWSLDGFYEAANTVTCVLKNAGNVSQSVGSGTLRATVLKF